MRWVTEVTPLDHAYVQMGAGPESGRAEDGKAEDGGAGLIFYEQLARSELYLLLDGEAKGDTIVPRVFESDGASFVLGFDLEERLADCVGGEAPYAALSGKVLLGMLAQEGLGLGLNLDVAPSSVLLPAEAINWLSGVLDPKPGEVNLTIRDIGPPAQLPQDFLTALDRCFASAGALADTAYVAAVTYETGVRGHLVAFINALPGAEPTLSQAVSDVLQLSALEAASIDVGFFEEGEEMTERLSQVALRFDLPKAEVAVVPSDAGPGMDPDRPPRLR